MSTSVTFNGVSYTVPAIADASWGTNVSNYLIAIATGCLQKTGGAFTLSAADVDFGATFGLKSVYYKSKTANIAAAGVVVLAVSDTINWRNNANGADLILGIDGSDNLTYNSVIIPTTSGSQTLTNKKLSDSTVTFNNVSDATKVLKFSLGSLTTGHTTTLIPPDINASDTVLVLTSQQTITNKLLSTTTVKFADASDPTKVAIFDLSAFTTSHTTTIVVPDLNGSGTMAMLAVTQAFTNKDYQGGTASNTSRMTIPSASTSTLAGLTRKQATIVYDTTLNQVFSDDGSNLNPIGSGAGEKNYVSTGSSNAGGWTASAAGITVATDTTAADLPRALTSKSGILLSRASGSTAFGYYRFTLDAADYNTKLKIAFAMKPGGSYVASDFKVDMYSNTASDYSGTSTRLVLSTDSSAISALPNATISYQTTFDASSSTAPYMELRIGLNASTSGTTLAISDVIVGPGIKPQGAAISPTVTYTPTFSAGFGTVSATTVYYTRRADCVGVIGTTTAGSVAGSAATMTLPNSWTALATQVCGRWIRVNSTGTTRKAGTLFSTASSNTIGFGSDDYTTAAGPTTSANGSALFSNSDVIYVEIIDLPIADLIGSGTVNVVQNDVEYVYNTAGTTSAGGADTTSFGYGPLGAAIGNIASTTPSGSSHTGMRVRFNTPIQITDKLELETDEGTSGARWVSFSASAIPFINQGVAYYGAYLSIVNATDVDVFFGNGGATTGTTYAANGSTTWTNITTWRWRVKKFAGGQAIGFANVAQSTSGLVKSAGQLLGTNTNDTAASGFVGELITGQILRANRAGISNGSATNITSISLTTGDWDVWGTVGVQGGSGTTMSQFIGWVGSVTAALPSELSAGVTYLSGTSAGIASADDFIIPIASIPVSVNATTTYYLGVRAAFAVSTLSAYGTIYARRRR